jgi:hypothetical protein
MDTSPRPEPERPHRGGSEPRPAPRTPSGAERRRHQRARADWPITVVLEDGVHQARIRDVSRGGVSFFLDRPIPEMTALRVQFDVPVQGGVRKIQGEGAVVRCERIARNLEHYEIAVFVQDMALPDRETVDGYVKGTED